MDEDKDMFVMMIVVTKPIAFVQEDDDDDDDQKLFGCWQLCYQQGPRVARSAAASCPSRLQDDDQRCRGSDFEVMMRMMTFAHKIFFFYRG